MGVQSRGHGSDLAGKGAGEGAGGDCGGGGGEEDAVRGGGGGAGAGEEGEGEDGNADDGGDQWHLLEGERLCDGQGHVCGPAEGVYAYGGL